MERAVLGAPGWWWLVRQGVLLRDRYIWFRASFPRYRYDQIMRLGWKVFIPITIVWVFVAGCFEYSAWLARSATRSKRMNRVSNYFKSLLLLELLPGPRR